MVSQVAAVETLPAPSELDALLMEARLIKDVQPRYNERLKDDKSFAVLAITRFDDFPKVWVLRETDDVQAERYGPFMSSAELRDAVRVLQKAFRFATCRLEMREDDPRRRFARPCLLHAIGRCTAPCAALVSKERYAGDVESLRKFLSGGREEFLRGLRAEMKEASKRLDFERAAELRDRARAVESLSRRMGTDYVEGDITPIDPREGLDALARELGLGAPPRSIEGVDVAHVSGEASVGSLVSFVDGIPFKNGYRRYRIKTVPRIDDFAMIREVVLRRFRRLREEGGVLPDVLLIDGGPGQLGAARSALAEAGAGPRVLLSLAKEEETVFREGRPVPMPKDSPALKLLMYVRDEAHRFAQHYHHLLRRKTVIG
jgi:excinuclease ABC subunit C